MGANTKIEWTDATFNPWMGCAKVSRGCQNCYAEVLSGRFGWAAWGRDTTRILTSDGYWKAPLGWNRTSKDRGVRMRVFCASLADVFDVQAPSGALDRLWKLIAETDCLDWQLLTKRPERIADSLPDDWGNGYRNVWLGISAEDQASFELRWPLVAAIPALLRFVSYEPALGPLVFPVSPDLALPDWLIAGGESGRNARWTCPAWVEAMKKQCLELGIPFFFKQWGVYQNNPIVQVKGRSMSSAVHADPQENGKGGAILDGELWRQVPQSPAANLVLL